MGLVAEDFFLSPGLVPRGTFGGVTFGGGNFGGKSWKSSGRSGRSGRDGGVGQEAEEEAAPEGGAPVDEMYRRMCVRLCAWAEGCARIRQI